MTIRTTIVKIMHLYRNQTITKSLDRLDRIDPRPHPVPHISTRTNPPAPALTYLHDIIRMPIYRRTLLIVIVNRQVNNWELQFIPIGQQEPIWASIYGLLKEDSTDCYVEGMVEDITVRKHSEEMLILSERMAAVGTMASGVAHEFNNIHVGVLGYSDLGARLEDIPETARTYFKTIHNY